VNEWCVKGKEKGKDKRFFFVSLPLFPTNLDLGKSFFSVDQYVAITVIYHSIHHKDKIFTKNAISLIFHNLILTLL
jgi:hypothetical protein